MEELFFTAEPETKLSTVMRINSEIITALAAMELAEENINVVTEILKKHSDFVIDTSLKVLKAETTRYKDSKVIYFFDLAPEHFQRLRDKLLGSVRIVLLLLR